MPYTDSGAGELNDDLFDLRMSDDARPLYDHVKKFIADVVDPMSVKFHELGKDKDDIFNAAAYCSEAVDTLTKFVIDAETYEELAAAVRAIDRVMRFDLFMIPTWYSANFWVAYYDMYRYPDTLPPYALGYLDFWWVDPEAEAQLESAGAFR